MPTELSVFCKAGEAGQAILARLLFNNAMTPS
jgi:hypothetical protein